MNIKELLEKRAALLVEVNKPETTAERFAQIRKDVEKIDFQIAEATKQADEERKLAEKKTADEKAKTDAEERAKRLPNGVLFDQSKVENSAERAKKIEELEKRAKTLKDGGKISIEKRTVVVASAPLGTVASSEINPAFEQVGTLDKLVHITVLEGAGAESYRKPFAKTITEGDITAEGTDYATAEPTFDYATINKIKITAYAEITEEIAKLPAANYIAEVENAVRNALRKKEIGQIIGGNGTGQFVGIVNAPTTIIEATQTKTIATVDENTLDNIIFDYGGDEDVEGDAYLILNKLTLKSFATVKGTDKKRAYDIVIKGNTGTINGIPFVCTSKVAPYATVTAGNPYIIYGKLQGYELTRFAAPEVEKSTDYKFKEGMIAFKACEFVGGSPAMWNGFLKVIKAAE